MGDVTNTPADNTTKKVRDSNIELLRIVCMFMIILYHFLDHGSLPFDSNTTSIYKLSMIFLSLLGKIGVNCFILITGYYLIKSSFSVTKIVKLWFEIFFYSMFMLLLDQFIGNIPIDSSTIISSVFPIIFEVWWFATAYFILYLISPFINKMIDSIDRDGHLLLIKILVSLWCIIPTFFGLLPLFDIDAPSIFMNYSNIAWFITLYVIAAYLRLFPDGYKWLNAHYKTIGVACFAFMFLFATIIDILGTQNDQIVSYSLFFKNMNTIPMALLSICLFIAFKNFKMGYRKMINIVASTTFGIYLIHESPLMKDIIWNDIFNVQSYTNSSMLLLYAFFAAAIVFTVCAVIDYLRIIMIEKNIMPIIERHLPKTP